MMPLWRAGQPVNDVAATEQVQGPQLCPVKLAGMNKGRSKPRVVNTLDSYGL